MNKKYISDKLDAKSIASLTDKNIPIEVIQRVESTNTLLKNKAKNFEGDCAVLIADEQTGGRGRYERKFHSPMNCGIYMSILIKKPCNPENSIFLTIAAAVAVCEAIESATDKKVSIKWVNDLFVDDKKICGILTEGSINPENSLLDFAVVGIGINIYTPDNDFDSEIKDIAGAVFSQKKSGLRNHICAQIINRFLNYAENIENKSFLDSYISRSFVVGKNITVIKSNGQFPAKAICIDNRCRLLVKYQSGESEYLSSGEISIKI